MDRDRKAFYDQRLSGGGMEAACNRPYGDGPPSDIRSFPFPLEEKDVALVKHQLGWEYGISFVAILGGH